MNLPRKRFLLLGMMLAACACACSTSPPSSSTFTRSQVGTAQSVEWGEVQGLRAVAIQNDRRGVATATGAALGGIGGSTIGSGTRANTAGAVAGAVAGGAVGNAMAGTTTAGVEITVRLESGQTVAVVQPGTPNDYRVGDRVRVTSDGTTTRVSR
jgi:outer membrane lipoprotein SlyB